jgi:hypothetical protein
MIIHIALAAFSVYLLIFHTYLIATGQTTWEMYRAEKISYAKYRSMFNEGILTNIRRVFCHGNAPHQWIIKPSV